MNRIGIFTGSIPIGFFTGSESAGILSTLLIGCAALLLLLAAPALGAPNPTALPTGGVIVSGTGSISVNGSQMTVNQLQSKMILNWNTFNIGQSAGVNFIQPSASSAALNRILDQNPSEIFGSLTSNGQVFLLNPNGIIFGPSAQVNVGSIVASSLNLSDADFLAGSYRFVNPGSAGNIINQGTITTSDYGIVALIAPGITNSGSILTPKGSIGFGAGNRVNLDFTGDGLINLSVSEAALNAAIANNGAVIAEGGRVMMSARAANALTSTVINNTGIIEADSISQVGGVIVLDGGTEGTVSNTGSISAAGVSPGSAGGSITLSGGSLNLGIGGVIESLGYSGGGSVYLTSGAGGISLDGNILSSNLYLNSTGTVTQTTPLSAAGLSLQGAGGNYQLTNYANMVGTLAADTGTVNFRNSTGFVIGSVGSLSGLTTTGETILYSGGSVTQTSPIYASGLLLLGAGGNYQLTNTANHVNTLAAQTGTLNFSNSGNIAIGSIGSYNGITTTGATSVNTSGNLQLNEQVKANASPGRVRSASAASGNASIVLAGSKGIQNNFGSGVLDAGGGKWLLYSPDPGSNFANGLKPDFIQYNAPFQSSPLGSGNGFLYSEIPYVHASLTGTVSKTYDGTTLASLSSDNFLFSAKYPSDKLNLSFPISGYYDDKNVGTNKSVEALGINILSASTAEGIPVYGYRMESDTISGNIGVINPAALSIKAASDTKIYDSTTASGASPTVSGLQNGDKIEGLSQVFDSRNAGKRTLLINGFTIDDGNEGKNYKVLTDSADGSINPCPISLAANDAYKRIGSDDPPFSYRIAAGKLFDGDTLYGSLTRVPGEDLGIYPINQGTLGNPNYLISFFNGNFIISYSVIPPAMVDSIQGSLDQNTPMSEINPALPAVFQPQQPSEPFEPIDFEAPESPAAEAENSQGTTAPTLVGTTGAKQLTGAQKGSVAGAVAAANGFVQQATVNQKNGDFKDAVTEFRQAADLLLKAGSLTKAREVVEMMKTAELEDYFEDPAIALEAKRYNTRLRDLPPKTAVIYTLVFPDRLDILLSMRTGTKRFSTAIDSKILINDIRKLRAGLERRTRWDYLNEARKFHKLIIGPLEPELSAHRIGHLVFIPDGALHTAPFAAFHDGERFLIERYAITVTPSLNLTDTGYVQRKNVKMFSAGLTESVQGFNPLFYVQQELDGIQNVYRTDRLVNSAFLEGSIKASLQQNPYSIVHIATHGNFAPNVSDSFLLAWDGRIDMKELDQMIRGSRKSSVELLSLSACQTAAGDDKAALGLAGVAVKAGARSALATLWSVSDQAAPELVVEFYNQLRDPEVSKAEALRAAQMKLIDDPRFHHPFYWSPFLLIGNWM